jgi:hypothetical protein
VPQVVHSESGDARALADRGPGLLHLLEVAATAATGEQMLRIRRRLAHGLEQRQRPVAERDLVLGLLLRRMRRLHPDLAVVEVELLPPGAEDLGLTSAGQQQEPKHIRHVLVRIFGESAGEPAEFIGGQIALSLGLGIALKALAGVVRP